MTADEITALADRVDALAYELAKAPTCHNGNADSCLRRQRTRNGRVQPYSSYRPAAMCSPCAAHWHASMSALALRDEARSIAMDEAMAATQEPHR